MGCVWAEHSKRWQLAMQAIVGLQTSYALFMYCDASTTTKIMFCEELACKEILAFKNLERRTYDCIAVIKNISVVLKKTHHCVEIVIGLSFLKPS